MTTPICDFVRQYAENDPVRLHMPGHKGRQTLITGTAATPEPAGTAEEKMHRFSAASDFRAMDITEVDGADVLYDPEGIIRESEENAAGLFGSVRTVYSAEGSSLCVRAMLYLAALHAARQGRVPRIAAGRNAHRTFIETAALLDLDVDWLGAGCELLRAEIRPGELEALFRDTETVPTAVYVTSPDYLGNCTELGELAELCHRHGALLLTDNAHGAYLKFLPESRHPLDCGADLCCDSAHKTLPVLTGGAYLHASASCPTELLPMLERAMALFASTSPSWLILQSLDEMNALLAGDYPERIRDTAARLTVLKQKLAREGWEFTGDEALKLTLRPKSRGYTGTELGAALKERGIVCEFSDPDYLVLMVTPENTEEELDRLQTALTGLPARAPVTVRAPEPRRRVRALRPREVLFRPFERIPAERSLGRILASPGISCPPAVPILLCGERIDENALELFRYYGIKSCDVVKD